MPPFVKGNTIGKESRFSKENQPANKGHKKINLCRKEAAGLSKADIVTIVSNVLAGNRTVAATDAANKEVNIVQAILSKELAQGNWRALMEIMKFAYGQTLEVKGDMSVKNQLDGMSDEELQKQMERFKKIKEGGTD